MTKINKRNWLICYFLLFYFLTVISVGTLLSVGIFNSAKMLCDNVQNKGLHHISTRILTTLKLVSSLAESEVIVDDNIDGQEKTRYLNSYSDNMGYMMIRYVDHDMYVWNENGPAASLAERKYLQQLFLTGETQVTDVFAAGVDGKTLNYTIAAPILKEGKVNGAVFAAVYYQEVDEFIDKLTLDTGSSVVLFGSRAQVMHSSNMNVSYGQYYIDLVQNIRLIGEKAKQVEENIINNADGSHWEVAGANLYYVSYINVPGTFWTLLVRVSMGTLIMQNIWIIIAAFLNVTALYAGLYILVYRFHKKRLNTVNSLIESVQKLERQIYQNEYSEGMDFRQIIKMTGKGLTDGLTGVVTRTVFMDRVAKKMAQNTDKLSVICFIDLDDLKVLNDTYGHEAGDRALKEIGYTLRKYEKLYDGMVGRYGGDEFVIYLTGFDDREDIIEVIDEMTASLHSTFVTGGTDHIIHCSVGATICRKDLTEALRAADEALYEVKRNDKGNYKLI